MQSNRKEDGKTIYIQKIRRGIQEPICKGNFFAKKEDFTKKHPFYYWDFDRHITEIESVFIRKFFNFTRDNDGVFCFLEKYRYNCIAMVGGTTIGKSPSIISPITPFGEMGTPNHFS